MSELSRNDSSASILKQNGFHTMAFPVLVPHFPDRSMFFTLIYQPSDLQFIYNFFFTAAIRYSVEIAISLSLAYQTFSCLKNPLNWNKKEREYLVYQQTEVWIFFGIM